LAAEQCHFQTLEALCWPQRSGMLCTILLKFFSMKMTYSKEFFLKGFGSLWAAAGICSFFFKAQSRERQGKSRPAAATQPEEKSPK
jgi:hypothetical protein